MWRLLALSALLAFASGCNAGKGPWALRLLDFCTGPVITLTDGKDPDDRDEERRDRHADRDERSYREQRHCSVFPEHEVWQGDPSAYE